MRLVAVDKPLSPAELGSHGMAVHSFRAAPSSNNQFPARVACGAPRPKPAYARVGCEITGVALDLEWTLRPELEGQLRKL